MSISHPKQDNGDEPKHVKHRTINLPRYLFNGLNPFRSSVFLTIS